MVRDVRSSYAIPVIIVALIAAVFVVYTSGGANVEPPSVKIVGYLSFEGNSDDLLAMLSPDNYYEFFLKRYYPSNYDKTMAYLREHIADLPCSNIDDPRCCSNLLASPLLSEYPHEYPTVTESDLCYDLRDPHCACLLAYYLRTHPDANLSYISDRVVLPSRVDLEGMRADQLSAEYYVLSSLDINACSVIPSPRGPACVVLKNAAAIAYFCGRTRIQYSEISFANDFDRDVCKRILVDYFDLPS